MDTESKRVIKALTLPGAQIQISIGVDSSGRVVGLTRNGVYILDPRTDEIVHSIDAPANIDCGFALIDDYVYFGSGVELWRYKLPSL